MTNFWIRSAIAAMTMAVTLSAAAQTKLLFSTFFPSAHPLYSKVLVPWARDVEAATEGRVIIEFATASLAPPPGQLDMVKSGVADIALQYAGVVPKRMQPELLTELPGPAASAATMSRALWVTHERYFQNDDRFSGLHLLSLFVFPRQEYFCVKTCIATLEELRSVKIATSPGTSARQYGAVTAGVVAGPASRFFELVSKGIVDAYTVVTPFDVFAFNLAPNTKGVLTFRDLNSAGAFALVMNSRRWASLGAADQKALSRLAGSQFGDRMSELDAARDRALQRLVDSGVTVNAASETLNEKLKSAWSFLDAGWVADANARGINGVEALRFYREQLVR
ncbi:MAG: hypothetical protein KF720_14225 [Rubrivivax sp.]|nr:hypothetical protein [Rubrivivax sp.]